MSGRSYRVIALIFLVFLVEGSARLISPYQRIPRAGAVPRNPGHKFGWPEYVQGDPKPGRKLTVLISNSQGYGVEIPDPTKIYFAQLRQKLAEAAPDVDLENWALPGLRTSDLAILTVQAELRGAERIIVLVTSTVFDAPEQVTLDYPDSDVRLLAGDPSAWPILSQTLLSRQIDWNCRVRRWLELHSSAIRFRTPAYQALSRHLPTDYQVFLFGHEMDQRLDDRDAPIRRMGKRREAPAITERLETFRAFNLGLNRRFAAKGGKVLYVWIPLCSDRIQARRLGELEDFLVRAGNTFGPDEYRCIDLTRSVPSGYFNSRSHFNEEGHRYFANVLARVLLDELQ